MMSLMNPVDRMADSEIFTLSEKSLMCLGSTRHGRQIWADKDDLTRHLFVSGSTGSGKTELLASMSANSIAAGSGLIFIDGKGDVSNFAKIYALASRLGRVEDVLLLNFSQGVPVGKKSDRFLSNKLNPFAGLSSDAIVQLVSGLMEDVGGDGAMWKGRAIAMLTGVVEAAVWLRDDKGIRLTVSGLRDMCGLRNIISLANDPKYADMPLPIRRALLSYLSALPGYNPDRGSSQSQTTLDQHGYLEMQTTRLFSSLADVYRHIFDEGLSEIDMSDVVLNRRILVVLLPVLEKSSDEVANLGRIVVALLKNMMSSAMAAPMEGDWATVVEKRPTNSPYPFQVIMDEVSHYMTDGMAAMAAQARSLGFSMVFAAQDAVTMENANQKEARAILANTNTKIYMSTQNPKEYAYKFALPSNDRTSSPREEAENQIKNRINALQFRMRHGPDSGEAPKLASEVVGLYEEIAALSKEHPYFTLLPVLESLRPGEFVIVRSGKFLIGRSMYVSGDIGRPDIEIPKFVPYDPDPDEIRRWYGRDGLKREFTEALGGGRLKDLGGMSPMPANLAAAFPKRSTSSKAAIRRSFASVGGKARTEIKGVKRVVMGV